MTVLYSYSIERRCRPRAQRPREPDGRLRDPMEATRTASGGRERLGGHDRRRRLLHAELHHTRWRHPPAGRQRHVGDSRRVRARVRRRDRGYEEGDTAESMFGSIVVFGGQREPHGAGPEPGVLPARRTLHRHRHQRRRVQHPRQPVRQLQGRHHQERRYDDRATFLTPVECTPEQAQLDPEEGVEHDVQGDVHPVPGRVSRLQVAQAHVDECRKSISCCEGRFIIMVRKFLYNLCDKYSTSSWAD